MQTALQMRLDEVDRVQSGIADAQTMSAARLDRLENRCDAMAEMIADEMETFRTMRRQMAELHQDVFHLLQAIQQDGRLTA